MKITINSCKQCPFTTYVYEHGFCGNICVLLSNVALDQGISSKCPFRTEKTIEVILEEEKGEAND